MKMYILLKDTVPLGLAVTAAAHAGTTAALKWQNHPDFQEWLKSFKKVTCSVGPEQFENAKRTRDHVVLTESSLNGEETAIVFLPRKEEDWPSSFRYYKLYR